MDAITLRWLRGIWSFEPLDHHPPNVEFLAVIQADELLYKQWTGAKDIMNERLRLGFVEHLHCS